jgi:CxxC motif-containing protein (DUF1111 family)
MKKASVRLAVTAGVVIIATTAVIATERERNHSHRPKLHPSQPHRPVPGGGPQFGDSLPGLTAEQQADFDDGRVEFEAIETAEGGLGPIFNGNACAACHSSPVTGGASKETVTRFGRRLTDGEFDPLASMGGTLLHRLSIDPSFAEIVPRRANVVAQRLSTPLFGAGLLEAITDDSIKLNAQQRQPDGIRGRVSMITDIVDGKSRVGRFGWKAQHASVLGFAADAYVNEMGITSRFFPHDIAPNGNEAMLDKYDKVADPEDVVDPVTGKGDIDRSAGFVRLLAPPPQKRFTADALAGQRVFERLNCAACHTPQMFTGPNVIAALSNARVALYSDLLLHNMGGLADGIEQGGTTMYEMKTAPLWGLRGRAPYLHDGRATTVTQAIQAHDGEASASRDRFNRLAPGDVHDLLEFLRSI